MQPLPRCDIEEGLALSLRAATVHYTGARLYARIVSSVLTTLHGRTAEVDIPEYIRLFDALDSRHSSLQATLDKVSAAEVRSAKWR